MRTLILKPVSRKKSVSMSFFTTNNNTVVISNLAPPAWNSITRFDANYLMFCLFGYALSFMMFSSFSSAVLLLHNQMRSICATPGTFFERGDLERTRHSLATWQDSRWRRIFARSFKLFSSKSFHICAKKPQDICQVDRTFSESKGKFFMEVVLSSKYSWKRNRFSIVIVNIWETRNKLLTLKSINFGRI